MKPYFPNPNLPDWPYLQVCVLPDLDRDAELQDLVNKTAVLLGEFPTVAALPPEWLHVTLQAIWHRPAAAVPPTERSILIDALTDTSSRLPPFRLQAGSLLSGGVGVVADLHPDHQIDDLFTAVRDTIERVCGAAAVTKNSRPAHMALAYAVGVEDGDQLQSRLRREVRPGHAPLTVDAIHLVEVTPDPAAALFRWQHIRRFPLGTAV